MSKKVVVSRGAPRPAGPYSAAVWAGDMLFLSGQIPLDPESMELVPGKIIAQAHRVFDNIEAVLSEAGLCLEDAVKTTVYLTSMEDFRQMNEVYESRFSPPYPARTAAAVSALPMGALIEVELVAVRPRGNTR